MLIGSPDLRSFRRRYCGGVVLLVAVLSPGLLTAQGPPPEPSRQTELVEKYDRDGDGKLSGEEIRSALPSEKGGRRSAGFGSRREERATRLLRHDREMQALMEKFDSNKNGKLDRDEMTALRNVMRECLSNEIAGEPP